MTDNSSDVEKQGYKAQADLFPGNAFNAQQCDREAAADIFGTTDWSRAQYLSGKRDKDPKVQALVRYRLAITDAMSQALATSPASRETIADIVANKVSGPQHITDDIKKLRRLDQLTVADLLRIAQAAPKAMLETPSPLTAPIPAETSKGVTLRQALTKARDWLDHENSGSPRNEVDGLPNGGVAESLAQG